MTDKLMRFDPAYGTERPYPSHAGQYRENRGRIAWLFNPWTGARRDPHDVGLDPLGYLMVPEGEELRSMSAGGSLGSVAGQELGLQYRNKAIE